MVAEFRLSIAKSGVLIIAVVKIATGCSAPLQEPATHKNTSVDAKPIQAILIHDSIYYIDSIYGLILSELTFYVIIVIT